MALHAVTNKPTSKMKSGPQEVETPLPPSWTLRDNFADSNLNNQTKSPGGCTLTLTPDELNRSYYSLCPLYPTGLVPQKPHPNRFLGFNLGTLDHPPRYPTIPPPFQAPNCPRAAGRRPRRHQLRGVGVLSVGARLPGHR